MSEKQVNSMLEAVESLSLIIETGAGLKARAMKQGFSEEGAEQLANEIIRFALRTRKGKDDE